MEDEAISLWNKKYNELTVGETAKVVGVYTVIAVVAPFTIMAVVGGAAHVYDKFKTRKARKEMKIVK